MLAESVAERMKEKGVYATTVSLWVKDTELKSFDRQMRVHPTNLSEDIAKGCYKLFLENFNWQLDVRSLGVRASGILEGEIQYDLFQKEYPDFFYAGIITHPHSKRNPFSADSEPEFLRFLLAVDPFDLSAETAKLLFKLLIRQTDKIHNSKMLHCQFCSYRRL